MAISYIGAAIAVSDTVAIPSHQAGDLIFGIGVDDAAASITLPSGWLNMIETGTASMRARIAYKIAQSSSETFGTWTNSSIVAVGVYRSSDMGLSIGQFDGWGNASSSTIRYTFNGVAPLGEFDNWVVYFGWAESGTATMTGAPSGYTNRVNAVDAVSSMGLCLIDSNGVITAPPSQTDVSIGVTINNASRGVVLREVENYNAGGSGGVPLIGHGGLVY